MLKQGISLLTLWLFLRPVVAFPAQAPRETPSVGAEESLVVYIEDFGQTQSSASPGDLRSLRFLAPGLFQLRLLELPSLTVRRVRQAPPCGGQPSPDKAQGPPPASQQREPPRLFPRQPEAAPPGHFFVLQGSVEFRLPDIALEYAVNECDGQSFKPVFQDTLPFTANQALEGLTIAAHAVALKLERAAPRTRVVVAISIEGDAPDQKRVQADLQHRLAETIAESADLAVADTGDYTVGALITFKKGGSQFPPAQLLKLIKGWDTVETQELYIQVRNQKYPLPPVTKSKAAVADFYAEVAGVVERDLTVVVLAEKRGWPELRGKMEIAALLARGKQLLNNCASETRACKDAQDAIPLLAEAASLAKGTGSNQEAREGLRLLSQAQMLAGNYADALASLDGARDLVKRDREAGKHVPPEEEATLLKMRGDACVQLKDYTSAVAAYDASLQLMPSQPDVYASKALALRYAGKRLEALESALEGLQVSGAAAASQSLHASAKDVIRGLHAEEFTKAEDAIQLAEGKGISLADEHALLISRREGHILDTRQTAQTAAQAEGPLQKALELHPSDPNVQAEIYANLARTHLSDGDLQKLGDYLTQAENLPPNQVSAENREWIARIRSRYWIMMREYSKAYASADAARQIMPSDNGDYAAAEAALLFAQDNEKAAGAAATPEQKREIARLCQQAVDLAAPLIAKRYLGADYVFAEAAHRLGLDTKTREQFESVLQQDPKDDAALNALMLVCSQYLFDFNCAFSAAKRDAALHDPNESDAAEAYVNLAEAAMLVGDGEQTRHWLDIALKQPNATPRGKSLAYLYHMWLAMRQGETDQLSTDFLLWQTATEQFRQTHDDLGWLFLGAKKALQDSNLGEKRKALLAAMMAALEDNTQPLPSFPGPGAL